MTHWAQHGQRLSLAMAVLMLSACASGPAPDISRIPVATDAQTSRDGLFTQPLKWSRNKPDCRGECPTMTVDSLVFPGMGRLTELVDHALAMMTGTGDEQLPPYSTLKEFEQYFWKTAAPRDEVNFVARTRYRNRHLTVIELSTAQYFTGAAHGITATQFLNWDNTTNAVLGLEDLLLPGASNKFDAALEEAHAAWLSRLPEAQENREQWARLWPFQPSSNFALTDQGIVVKYDAYEIAPYSSGQPELLIPYARLEGILKPLYLPHS